MTTRQYSRRNVMLTFSIGFVAGTTPFVFMKLLPMMLHPELYTAGTGEVLIMLSGVVLTGSIIGVITSLIFGGEFDQKDPKEIFVYALGIPAILISTVSGLMTDFNAMQKISTVQANASAALLTATPSSQNIPEVTTSPADRTSSGGPGQSLLPGTAWAGTRPEDPAAQVRTDYIVVIGTYSAEREARAVFNKYQQRRFKTEAYIQKNLELRKLDGKPVQYIIIYGSFEDPLRAQRAYDLLKINDPDLNAGLMKAVSK